jgi:hypothetical protein
VLPLFPHELEEARACRRTQSLTAADWLSGVVLLERADIEQPLVGEVRAPAAGALLAYESTRAGFLRNVVLSSEEVGHDPSIASFGHGARAEGRVLHRGAGQVRGNLLVRHAPCASGEQGDPPPLGSGVLVQLPEIQKLVPQLLEALIDVKQLRVAGVKANPAPGSSAPASQNLQEAFESGQTACHRSQTTFSSSRTSFDARNRPFDENESTGEEMTRHLSFSKGSLDGSGRPKGHFFRITCQLERVECRTVHELWVLKKFVYEISPRPSRT